MMSEVNAREAASKSGQVFVSPYNDIDVVAGQGTIALEICQQLKGVDAVFVALGGGGLISGIGAYLRTASPHTEVIACSPINSPAMHECIKARKILDIECHPTISDATAGNTEEGSVTLDLCLRYVTKSVLVTEDEIKEAMQFVIRKNHMKIEGSAGVAIAAFGKL